MGAKDFTKYAVHCGETVLYYEPEGTWHYWWDIKGSIDYSEAEVILSLPRSFDFKGNPLYGVSSHEEEAMIVLTGMGE